MKLILTLFAAILFGTASAGAATIAGLRNPVKINRCDARHNPGSAGGYVGYLPGYYPRGSYYWTDMYAHRFYQPGVAPTGTLYIDYANATHHNISTIEFGLVARGVLVAEVRDVGTFSPGAEIKHSFGLNPSVFPLGTALPACIPLRVTFADGTKWRNLSHPRSDRALYQMHP